MKLMTQLFATTARVLLFSIGIMLSYNSFAKSPEDKDFVTQTELETAIDEIELREGPAGADSIVPGPEGPAGADALSALPELPADDSGRYRLVYDTASKNFVWELITDSGIYHIGDTGPGGGIVFYLSDYTGTSGLEAAPVDQSNGVQWGCYGTAVGGTEAGLGTGEANTSAINAQCELGTAARIADDYRLNGIGGWYLPSKVELNLMWLNLADADGNGYNSGPLDAGNLGGFANSYYWSSTESDSSDSWLQTFDDGSQYYGLKYYPGFGVRAVRAF